MAEPNGRKMDDLYKFAWSSGLKTTYYLRTTSATAPEKSTVRSSVLNAVTSTAREEKEGNGSDHSYALPFGASITEAKACSLSDPDCEACQ
jgi:ribonucleoside-diphosphate reductase alpha chain